MLLYSHNEEDFDFEVIEECLEYLLQTDADIEEGDVVSIFEGKPYYQKASDYFDVGYLIEQLSEAHADRIENSDWLDDVNNNQEGVLQSLLKGAIDAWADRFYLHPKRYPVQLIRELRYKLVKYDDNYSNCKWEKGDE